MPPHFLKDFFKTDNKYEKRPFYFTFRTESLSLHFFVFEKVCPLPPHFLVLSYATGLNSIQLNFSLKIRFTGIILNSFFHFHNVSLIRGAR